MELFNDIEKNKKHIKNTFKGADDVVYKDFENSGVKYFLFYIDNIVDSNVIDEAVLTNMMIRAKEEFNTDAVIKRSIAVGETKIVYTFDEIFDAVLLGDTVVLVENDKSAVIVSSKGWPSRGIPSVDTEVTIQGPKDAFTEVGSINTVLVRRRIRDTKLKVRRIKCGRRSKTDIAVMYIKDIAEDTLVNDILKDIEKTDIDAVFDSGYLAQLMEDRYKSPFPVIQLTQRPDKTASALYEGRVAVLVDNSPFAILLPTTLNMFFQSAEDYYERWEIMSFMRILRYFAAITACILPALYIVLTVYRPDLLPVTLALKISSARRYVPFFTIAEVLIMEIAFELLREASVRLPSPAGSAFGIVGGIVIGSAAVEAGITGPVVVIIAALSGICSFAVPNASFVSAMRIVKFFIIFMSSVFGFFGFFSSAFLILIHLSSIESYGVPYLYPFCSAEKGRLNDLKDSIVRVPLRNMKKRPVFAKKEQQRRMKTGEMKNENSK